VNPSDAKLEAAWVRYSPGTPLFASFFGI
jgi:hypothetical protein